jgi:hypothetical protein
LLPLVFVSLTATGTNRRQHYLFVCFFICFVCLGSTVLLSEMIFCVVACTDLIQQHYPVSNNDVGLQRFYGINTTKAVNAVFGFEDNNYYLPKSSAKYYTSDWREVVTCDSWILFRVQIIPNKPYP